MTATKERGLICRGPEALAIWSGRQSQVRRLVKPQPQRISAEDPGWVLNVHAHGRGGTITWDEHTLYRRQELLSTVCPFGEVGDLIFVKEAYRLLNGPDRCTKCGARKPNSYCIGGCKVYLPDLDHRAGHEELGGMWKLSSCMPRWAARSVRQITDVQIERQDDQWVWVLSLTAVPSEAR